MRGWWPLAGVDRGRLHHVCFVLVAVAASFAAAQTPSMRTENGNIVLITAPSKEVLLQQGSGTRSISGLFTQYADVASRVTAVEGVVQDKADASTVSGVNTRVSKLEDGFSFLPSGETLVSSNSDVVLRIGGKETQVSSLLQQVADAVDSATFQGLSGTVSSLQATVGGKADQSAVTDALADKIDQTALDAALVLKTDKSTTEALDTRLTDLSSRVDDVSSAQQSTQSQADGLQSQITTLTGTVSTNKDNANSRLSTVEQVLVVNSGTTTVQATTHLTFRDSANQVTLQQMLTDIDEKATKDALASGLQGKVDTTDYNTYTASVAGTLAAKASVDSVTDLDTRVGNRLDALEGVVAHNKATGTLVVQAANDVVLKTGTQQMSLATLVQQLGAKADASTVQTALDGKVAQATFNTLNDKVSGIETTLSGKADASTVNTALASKAEKAEVDTALDLKADASALTQLHDLVQTLTANYQDLNGAHDLTKGQADDLQLQLNGLTTTVTNNKESAEAKFTALNGFVSNSNGNTLVQAAQGLTLKDGANEMTLAQIVGSLNSKATQDALSSGLGGKVDTNTFNTQINSINTALGQKASTASVTDLDTRTGNRLTSLESIVTRNPTSGEVAVKATGALKLQDGSRTTTLQALVEKDAALEASLGTKASSDALSAAQTTLQQAIDGKASLAQVNAKADASALTTAQTTLQQAIDGKASLAQVNAKADQSALNSLSTTVTDLSNNKADKSALNSLTTTVNSLSSNKADASTVSSLSTTVGGLTTTLNTLSGTVSGLQTSKADASALTTLSTTVSSLTTTVNSKAAQSALNSLTTTVNTKAAQSTVDAIAADVASLKSFRDALFNKRCTGANILGINQANNDFECRCPAKLFPFKYGIRTVGFQLGSCTGCDTFVDDTPEARGLSDAVTGTGSVYANGKSYNIVKYDQSGIDRLDVSGGTGDFPDHVPYPAGLAGEDFVFAVYMYVSIPAGWWTIGVGSDDGRYLEMTMPATFQNVYFQNNLRDGGVGTNKMGYEGATGHVWSTATFYLSQPQDCVYIKSLFFERGGGDSFEMAIAAGARSDQPMSSNSAWKILRDGVHGWRIL